jgi:hypothetical protein
MSLKKKLLGIPGTILGIVVGLAAGSFAVARAVLDNRFPKIGLLILLLTPLVSFGAEATMSRMFGDAYWTNLAGRLLKAYRYIINQDFRLKFVCEMRFEIDPADDDNQPLDFQEITAPVIFNAVHAEPGGEPEPGTAGMGFANLEYRNPPFRIFLRWYEDPADDYLGKPAATVFTLTMEPETMRIPIRRAKDDLDGMMTRLNKLQKDLRELVGIVPKTLVNADAWLGERRPVPASNKHIDKVSRAEYQMLPGHLHVNGEDLSALGTVNRYVGTLEEPPDPES